MRYCGRDWTPADLDTLRTLIAAAPRASRSELSRQACAALGWYKPDGAPKAMSCRVAMLRMHADGLITLPPPRGPAPRPRTHIPATPATDPALPISGPLHQLGPLQLHLVTDKPASRLWNEYIARYHYLGYTPLPGTQLRYFARAHGRIVALLGYGAAAWRLAPRDHWIGWTDPQRQRNLHLIANNARYLILPWVRVKNLASHLLALAARRLGADWTARYAYRPVLLETFVDTNRYPGTCYRAANWLKVGTTQGRGKLDRNHTARLPRKDIWLYPLTPHFRSILCS